MAKNLDDLWQPYKNYIFSYPLIIRLSDLLISMEFLAAVHKCKQSSPTHLQIVKVGVF